MRANRVLITTWALWALLLLAASAPAAELQLALDWKGGALPPPAGVAMKLYRVPTVGPWELVAEKTVDLLQPAATPVTEGSWAVTVEGPDIWAPYSRFTATSSATRVRLEVFPGGVATGKLVPPAGEELPEQMKVRFSLAPGGSGPPPGIESCQLTPSGVFSCRLPALKLDLRLRAGNMLSQYRWGLEVPRGRPIDVGSLELEQGASVVGWVAVDGPSSDLSKARVALEREALATPLASETNPRGNLMAEKTGVNDRGFFYFNGVEPGAYLLTASLEPYGPATATVRVVEATEAELRAPLLLAAPEVLTAQVNPPHDPYGDPWRAVLLRSDKGRQKSERVGERQLGLDGYLRWEGLARGTYLVSILGFDNKPWALTPVELGTDPMPLTLSIQPVEVRGLVELGKIPLAATLWFGGRFGGVQTELRSNDEGRFVGVVPRPGEWKVEVEAEDVRVSLGKVVVQPKAGEAVAEVHLKLPDTKVKLRIVDEDGRPARARVNVSSANLEQVPDVVQKLVDESGACELRGLPPGRYFFLARGQGGIESAVEAVELAEGREPATVELRLRPMRQMEVRVASRGHAVPGAQVLVLPTDVAYAETSVILTDAVGLGSAVLPPASRQAQLLAYAPGLAFHLSHRGLPEGGSLDIDLGHELGILRLQAPVREDQSTPQATLHHQGASLGWQSLSAVNREVRKSGLLFDKAVIPNAEPGHYSLCPILEAQALPQPSDACVSGQLMPNGELELTLE